MNQICAKYSTKKSKKPKAGSDEEEKKPRSRPKKPKKDVDPNAPKKPTANAYLLYCNDRRPHLLEERPELKNDPQGLARIVGDEWRTALPEDTKKIYHERVAHLKEQYENELARYNLLTEGENKMINSKAATDINLIPTQSDKEETKALSKDRVLKTRDSEGDSDEDSSSFASSDNENDADDNSGSHKKALESSEGESDVIEPELTKKVKKQ